MLDPGVAMREKWSYSKLLYLHSPPPEHSSLLLYALASRPSQVRSNNVRHLPSWFVNSTRPNMSPFTGSSCCTKTFCISVMKHINEIRATYRALKSCPINGRLNDQISGQDNDENGATCLVKSARGTCLVSRVQTPADTSLISSCTCIERFTSAKVMHSVSFQSLITRFYADARDIKFKKKLQMMYFLLKNNRTRSAADFMHRHRVTVDRER